MRGNIKIMEVLKFNLKYGLSSRQGRRINAQLVLVDTELDCCKLPNKLSINQLTDIQVTQGLWGAWGDILASW